MAKNDYLENRLLSRKCSRKECRREKMPAANVRFGATAAESADLKGSAKIRRCAKPPSRCRQCAGLADNETRKKKLNKINKMRKICIFMGILSTLFGCRQNLTEQEKSLCKSLDIDENVAIEIKAVSKSVIEQLPQINEYGEVLEEKFEGIYSKVPTENYMVSPKILDFVSKNKSKFQERNYNIFVFDSGEGNYLAVIKGKSDTEVLKWRQTNGINYDIDNDSIISKLQEWKSKFDFILLGAGMDWLQIQFITQPLDFDKFAEEVYEFCPDIVDQGIGDLEKLAPEMKRMNGIFLWWD